MTPVLSNHRLPLSDLDQLAAGKITASIAKRIHSVERSRRMLMLRAVVEAYQEIKTNIDSPLSPPTFALDLLIQNEERDTNVVTNLITYPSVGIWVVRILKQLQEFDASVPAGENSELLWKELGYLHLLAASASLSTGLPSSIDIPIINNAAYFPTLGRFTFPNEPDNNASDLSSVALLEVCSPSDGPTSITTKNRRFVLPSKLNIVDGGWTPLPRSTPDDHSGENSVLFDNCDPYRDFRDSPVFSPTDLSHSDVESWKTTFNNANQTLIKRHADSAILRSIALKVIVPLPQAPIHQTMSASYNEAFGSALISLHRNSTELAATLIHEARHSTLNALLHQVPLLDQNPAEDPTLLFAPWRGDPRPPIGVLHGAYAFSGVADFWRIERHSLTGVEADLAHFEFALWRATVGEALKTLLSCSELTPYGRQFATTISNTVASWKHETVPERVQHLVNQEVTDLRAVWKARHTRASTKDVQMLANEFVRQTDPTTLRSVQSQLQSDYRFTAPDPRGELRREILKGPQAVDEHSQTESYAKSRSNELIAAEVALVSGDFDKAISFYLDALSLEPSDPSIWVGLGIATSADGQRSQSNPILQRPELVSAVYLDISNRLNTSVDPLEVGKWIAQIPGIYNTDLP